MSYSSFIIEVHNLCAVYGRCEALTDISLNIEKNSRWAVIGPNGAGKSTLIKTMAGLIKPSSGYITVNGCDIRRYSSRKRARAISYMPQKPDGLIPYTVYDYVMLGRYSMMGLMGVPSEEDREAAAEAIEICDIKHLENRIMSTLSGGELQRALLAGAVAQSAPVLLLDEPTTFLDPAHERLFFEALSRLSRKRELTIVMITHDINSALYQCTHIAALKDGRLLYGGTTEEFRKQCPAFLEDIFGIRFMQFNCSELSAEAYGSWGMKCCQ